MFKKSMVLTIAVLIAAMYIGCGPKTIKPESVLDTPENHYNQGMRLLDKGNYNEAKEEFTRARDMNKKYPQAYVGLALVDAFNKSYKEAFKNVDYALEIDGKCREAFIAKGRILGMERKGDDWWKDAIKVLDKALKDNLNDPEVWYYKGMTYKVAYMFSESVSAYAKVVTDKNSVWATKANADWELVQKIVRAAPGTKVGAKIALMDKIDRADIAVLFMEELKLPMVLEKKREKVYDTSFKAPDDPMEYKPKEMMASTGPTDIANHWAKNWITEIVEIHGMEMFPDHTFRPDAKMTRAEFALLIQNIIILSSGDESLATKYFGEESHYPDVNSSHPAYNAISLCVQRGILKTNMDGSFGLSNSVSGADALLSIRDFQNALKQTF